MTDNNIATLNKFAFRIDNAAKNATAIPQLSLEQAFSEDEAYAIQRASLVHRYERGEKLVGLKMGFTSVAKMKQMGVSDMIWGRLTDQMLYENGAELDLSNFIHPRAEPEICFRTTQVINKEVQHSDIPNYVDAIAPAIEIIDSRFENFKFSLEDVIADNCSSTAFVVGDWLSPETVLSNLSVHLVINGEDRKSGNTDAILGDPWKSFLAATRLAEKYGQVIPAGSYLMAGAATAAEFLKAGDHVEAKIETLGKVMLECKNA
ncbi:fumarylacetoacetate hydrolase family protein [Chitinophagales bacterium]|nr:fumarylacetoacetate hydrolase family protein [Chitinophagales bacterium]